MPKLFDRVKVNIATTGAGTVTFGPASSTAFLTPAEAGAIDGNTVRYVIVDGSDFEEGVGTILASVAQMSRDTVTRSKIGGSLGAAKINLSGTAVLVLTASAADILNPANNLSELFATRATARGNLGLGSAATQNVDGFLQPGNNLGDVTNIATARANLGLSSAAVYAASAFAQVANSLSDLGNKPAARTNLGAIGAIRIQTFTASGTYTPHNKMVFCLVRAVGGGGGGGASSYSATRLLVGGGGAGGSYAEKFFTAADIGASKAVSIGAGGGGGSGSPGNGGTGGDTTFGSTLLIAKGSTGGLATVAAGGVQGGSFQTGSVGDYTQLGEVGDHGWYSVGGFTNFVSNSGKGGSSLMGPGAMGVLAGWNANVAGNGAQLNTGGGGGGAATIDGSNAVSGGGGGSGKLVVIEYCTE